MSIRSIFRGRVDDCCHRLERPSNALLEASLPAIIGRVAMTMTSSHGQPCTDSTQCPAVAVHEMSSSGVEHCDGNQTPAGAVVEQGERASRKLPSSAPDASFLDLSPESRVRGMDSVDPHFPILVYRKPRVGYTRTRSRSGQRMTCHTSGTPHLDLISLLGRTKTACPTSGPSCSYWKVPDVCQHRDASTGLR